MSLSLKTFNLYPKGVIPAFGLGTFLSKPMEVQNAVETAIRAGYRHIDLAWVYGNQREVGAALRNVIPSVIKREDLFVTTKLWNHSHASEAVEKELDDSLKQLGLDYVDLYLMHWPIATKDPRGQHINHDVTVAETWEAMNTCRLKGKVKYIGVSNFAVDHLKELIHTTGIHPTVNQVELHPLLHQDDLLEYAQSENIHITAYYPLGGASKTRTPLVEHPIVKEVAAKYPGASPANVLLNWGLARGTSVIPKSVNAERIQSNFREFDLSKEDLQRISEIGKNKQQRFVTGMTFKWGYNLFDSPEEQGAKLKPQIYRKARL